MWFLIYYARFLTFLVFFMNVKANIENQSDENKLETINKRSFKTSILNAREIKFNYQYINEGLYSILGLDQMYFQIFKILI